jgi:nitrate reductase gamma subunit
MTQGELSLILSAFGALAIVFGAMAAVVLVAFLAGLLVGRRHDSSKVLIEPVRTTSDRRRQQDAAGQTHDYPD